MQALFLSCLVPAMTSHFRRPLLNWMLVAIASFVLLSAAGTPALAAVATESRQVGSFEAVAVHGHIDLVVRQGEKEAVEVRADDQVLPLVETVVETGSRGPTLVVRIKRGEVFRNRGPVQVTVDVVKLTQISSAGSGDVRVQPLKTPSLRLSLAGSSDAKLDGLTTDLFELRLAGSGNVLASGSAAKVKIAITGSGDVSLKSLVADDVTVSIAGSGDAKVTANKALGVSIAGSGDVEYGGNATAIRTSVAGSGRIVKR